MYNDIKPARFVGFSDGVYLTNTGLYLLYGGDVISMNDPEETEHVFYLPPLLNVYRFKRVTTLYGFELHGRDDTWMIKVLSAKIRIHL